MKSKEGENREAGLALLEVIVALALITATVLAVGANVVSVAQGHRVSSDYTIAVNLAQQKMEEAKARGPLANGVRKRGHPLAGRSRSTDISREKNFLLSPFFLLAQSVIFR